MFIHSSDVLAKPAETWLSSMRRSRQFHVCLFLSSLINVFRANIAEREWGIRYPLSLVNSSLAMVTMESCPKSHPCFTPFGCSALCSHLLLIEAQRRNSPEPTAFQLTASFLCVCRPMCVIVMCVNFCVSQTHVTRSRRVKTQQSTGTAASQTELYKID